MRDSYARSDGENRVLIDTCNRRLGDGIANVEILGRVDIDIILQGTIHKFKSKDGTDRNRSMGDHVAWVMN